MFRPVAYVAEGAHYCPACAPPPSNEAPCSDPFPIYGWETDSIAGAGCDACRAFYVPGNDWLPLAEADAVRWSRCAACNAQRPYSAADYRYARRDAWRGRLACHRCGKRGTVRF